MNKLKILAFLGKLAKAAPGGITDKEARTVALSLGSAIDGLDVARMNFVPNEAKPIVEAVETTIAAAITAYGRRASRTETIATLVDGCYSIIDKSKPLVDAALSKDNTVDKPKRSLNMSGPIVFPGITQKDNE